MTKNPFEKEKRTLQSGYYFDERLRVLCYIFKEDHEMFGKITKAYSRLNKESNEAFVPPFFKEKTNRYETRIEDCKKLNYTEYSRNAEDIVKDFRWICKKDAIKHSFINFLMEEENYEFLMLFNKVVDKKIENVKTESKIQS